MPVDTLCHMPAQHRAAAHQSWAHTPDRSARTAPAREAFEKRFEREVDPDNELSPAERARRAESARKAYFLRMAHHREARKRSTDPRSDSVTIGWRQ